MSTFKRIYAGLVGALLMFAITPGAQATTFASRVAFDAANPGLTTIDFEGIAPANSFISGQENAFDSLGVTFSNPITSGSISIADSNAFATPTDVLFANANDPDITITFAPDTSAVGFDLRNLAVNETLSVTVFDALSNTLATELVAVATTSNSFIGFSGFAADIQTVEINGGAGQGNLIFLDDLSFSQATEAPEPGALGLFGVGLLGLAVLHRRRTKNKRHQSYQA